MLYPGSYIPSRQDKDISVSPTQTILLKLLDSFLQSIPASFLDEGDHFGKLAGFLADAFLIQAENGCRAIQLVTSTGTPSSEPKATTRANDGSVRRSSSGAADLQLSSIFVALVLLSTSLSSMLLSERENEGGTVAHPVLVSMTLNAISGSRSATGSGFIESLLGSAALFRSCFEPKHGDMIFFKKLCAHPTPFCPVSILGRSNHKTRMLEFLHCPRAKRVLVISKETS